jgi:hypothetical protein
MYWDSQERRRILLEAALDSDDGFGFSLFEEIRSFYTNVVNGMHVGDKPDLIVCMARKSWCLLNAFINTEMLDLAGIDLIHDKMLTPWFNENKSRSLNTLKVALIDDTYLTGRAVDDCIRRLVYCYGVLPKNITLCVYAMQDKGKNFDNRKKISFDKEGITGSVYKVRVIKNKGGNFWVRWGGRKDGFFSEKEVRAFSLRFVEAIHACSEPYVANIPAYRFDFSEIQDVLNFKLGEPGACIEQRDLPGLLSDPNNFIFHNITTQQMYQWDVEAFMLMPHTNSSNKFVDWLPNESNALSFCSLRFYINRKAHTLLFVPYISLKACKLTSDLSNMFPDDIKFLLSESSTGNWDDLEGQMTAHRLLRYATSYVWGKHILSTYFGVSNTRYKGSVTTGGILSYVFTEWLNNENRIYSELRSIYMFFSNPGNVIEDVKMSGKDTKLFNDAFKKVFTMNNEQIDCYKSSLALFREMMEEERRKNEAVAFKGVPIKLFAERLEKLFSFTKDVVSAAIFMLCDVGAAVTQVYQRGRVVGTYLVNGEQSCHSIYNICVSYSFFLTRLMEKMESDNLAEDYYNKMKDEIYAHFIDMIRNGVKYGVHIDHLMKPLQDIWDRKDLPPYHASEYPDAFDSSSMFFNKLWKRIEVESRAV